MQERRNSLCHPYNSDPFDLRLSELELEEIKDKLTNYEYEILRKGMHIKHNQHMNGKKRSKRRSK